MKDKRLDSYALGLILLHFLVLICGLPKVYITADESAYIAGGYTLLARGREALSFLSQRGYPPLLAGLEALFLYAAEPDIPVTQLAGWPNSYDVFARSFEPYIAPLERNLFTARLPTVWLMVLLGAVVYCWAKALWGAKAGLLALVMLVFDPSLLAHGRLAHTDAGVVALGTAALYVTWRWARAPQWRWTLLGGALLGLTMLAKVSGLFWAAAVVVSILVVLLQGWKTGQRERYLLRGGLLLGVSLGVFWSGYAFTWGYMRGFYLPLPAPAYWESVLYLRNYTTEVCALGKRWYQHLWWYYPLCFVIKNPLLLLLGLLLGGASLLRRTFSLLRALALWFFPVIYTVIALLEGMNIGYRHMLPIHPYLYLIIGGGVVQWVREGHRWRNWALIVGCIIYAAGTLRIFPYELSYFNALVGGAQGGYLYLADSNVDWGQTPPEVIKAFVQAHPGTQTAPPAASFRPSPGSYLVSASYLQGVGIADPFAYEWFRHWQPKTSVNYALLAYDVPPLELTWVAQCGSPGLPLDTTTILSRTGGGELRLIGFDCRQAWIYPAGGREAGIYLFHYDLFWPPRLQVPSFLFGPPMPKDAFMARRLAGTRLSFEKSHADNLPAFVLYEMDSPPSTPPHPQAGNIARAEMPPSVVRDSRPLKDSVSLANTLFFLGISIYPDDDHWETETWWQAKDGPINREFSIMAHLVTADGNAVSVADGLGVSPLVLRFGDIIVQRHRFPKPHEGTDYWLRTGAYWLDTMERWRIDGAADADTLLIALGH